MKEKRAILLVIFSVAVFFGTAGCKSKQAEPEEKLAQEKLTSAAGEEGEPEEAPALEEKAQEEKAHAPGLDEKEVLLIVACKNFRDEELEKPRERLLKEGFKVTVASDATEGCRGMMGAQVKVDAAVQDVQSKDFDAVVFIGGTGAKVFFDDAHVHKLAREAAAGGKVLGAICISPSILARAGVLKGKRATVWPGKEFIDILKEGGAEYAKDKVVVDGNCVTANGPDAASAFGEKIIELLGR